ncbi:MAG: hypothetical protein RLZZ306_3161 [Bacteroidota bacterium]|jgi:hypothetical protein
MSQSEAIIFLAENRKCYQTLNFRSFITLPTQNPEIKFDSIIKFADNTLSPQKSRELVAESDYIIIFLPLVGALEITDYSSSKLLNSGEIGIYYVNEKDELSIQNPYESELINYLEIWIKTCSNMVINPLFIEFDINNEKNKLVALQDSKREVNLFIGKYDGRAEGYLEEINEAFVFVINGVFEVNNCLLEMRSGLSLLNWNSIEFEGLSKENIILILSNKKP